jgi:hypothetical protein
MPYEYDTRLCLLLTDDLLVVGGCKGTMYGCCPDGLTPAEGLRLEGCPSKDPIPRGSCIEAPYGCCVDGLTPAQGPFNLGCPHYTCKVSQLNCIYHVGLGVIDQYIGQFALIRLVSRSAW